MDERACGLDKVFDTMLDLQSGNIRPCVLRKIGEKLVVLISWPGNGTEVERRCPCITKQRRKYVAASTSRFPLRSTRSELARRKLEPNRGRDTSAMTKSHQYCFIAKRSVIVRFPNVQIMLPLAATNEASSCEVRVAILVAGKTPTSAPVSTKNQPPEILSHTKRRPSMWLEAMAPTDAQPTRFPAIHTAAGIYKPSHQTYNDNSKGWVLLGVISFWALMVFMDAAGQRQ